MKKTLISILIVISIAQLFVPFGVDLGSRKNIDIIENKAEALDPGEDDQTGVRLYGVFHKTDTSITAYGIGVYDRNSWFTKEKMIAILTEPDGSIVGGNMQESLKGMTRYPRDAKEVSSVLADFLKKDPKLEYIYKQDFVGLTPSHNYYAVLVAKQDWKSLETRIQNLMRINLTATTLGIIQLFDIEGTFLERESNTENEAVSDVTLIPTSPKGETTTVKAGEVSAANETAILPVCALDNIGGCVGIVLYRLVFQPSSYLFAITGKLLDYTIFYSIQDTSYRSQFVVEGWGIVRDICNMFFIFILLYIAFSTILNTGGSKTKEMIIHLVVIGLMINFSLFAVQVIIDASNILTRVFYNQITIETKQDGKLVENPGLGGSKQLTEALVKKINPQQLIIQANRTGSIPAKGITRTTTDEGKGDTANNKIDNATFIMVVIMSSIMNIVGLWVFFTVSIVFITRVVGLWIAMILAPIAFFSHIVPKMDNIDMIGWSKWWSETLKLAFLAPVFIFFLYIIIQFLDSGLGIMNSNDKTGLDFFIAIIIPFAFLMVLLVKAKDITTKMSGTLGEKITNGIKTAGALALGATAIGTASIGRRVIGQTMAKASRGDTATQKFETAQFAASGGDNSYMNNLTGWQKFKGKLGSGAGLGSVYGKTDGVFDHTGRMTQLPVKGGVGNLLNKSQKETNDSNAARKKSDEAVDKAGYQGKEWEDLSGTQQTDVVEKYGKENHSKFSDKAEKNFRENAVDANGVSLGLDVRNQQSGQLPALDSTQKEQVKKDAQILAQEDLKKAFKTAAEGVNAFTRVIAKANTASYDIRKLSTVTSDKRASIFSKIPVALIGAVATGVRAGLKNGGMSNGSVKIEGKFMKDLGSVISDSLKTMKINVDLSGIAATKSTAKEK